MFNFDKAGKYCFYFCFGLLFYFILGLSNLIASKIKVCVYIIYVGALCIIILYI